MLVKEPYFMKNKNWYYITPRGKDGSAGRFELTAEGMSIPEVVQSHKEYYEAIDNYVDPSFYYESMLEAEKLMRERLTKEGKSAEEIEKIITKWKDN